MSGETQRGHLISYGLNIEAILKPPYVDIFGYWCTFNVNKTGFARQHRNVSTSHQCTMSLTTFMPITPSYLQWICSFESVLIPKAPTGVHQPHLKEERWEKRTISAIRLGLN